MSDLVRNPEDWFSHDKARIVKLLTFFLGKKTKFVILKKLFHGFLTSHSFNFDNQPQVNVHFTQSEVFIQWNRTILKNRSSRTASYDMSCDVRKPVFGVPDLV